MTTFVVCGFLVTGGGQIGVLFFEEDGRELAVFRCVMY